LIIHVVLITRQNIVMNVFETGLFQAIQTWQHLPWNPTG